ncbi:MAG: hypothetical protein WA294_14100 [Acidobacteriaceae bacterium]
MPTTFLNLTDLDNRIRDFEERFQIDSVEMLQNESARARISEDLLLRWEAYLKQRVYLRDQNMERHSTYLYDVRRGDPITEHQEADEVAFAA